MLYRVSGKYFFDKYYRSIVENTMEVDSNTRLTLSN